MSQRLEGAVAIITGAGRGIGREYALRFAEEGAKLLLPDINLEMAENVAKEIRTKGRDALAMKVDISDEGDTKIMAETAKKQYGKVDILLNNAAIYYGIGGRPWDAYTVSDWDRMFEVNVRGTWLCCKAVVPMMKEQGKGKIINISSNIIRPVPFSAENKLAYTCSKAAVYTMTQVLARALGDFSINVNGIAPGFVASEASKTMYEDSEPIFAKARAGQCIHRTLEPADLPGTAVFLASSDSDAITGQILIVDYGDWLK